MNQLKLPICTFCQNLYKPSIPFRPILSGRTSPTVEISRFLDIHLGPLVVEQQSYLRDTTDFIIFIEELNSQGPLPTGFCLLLQMFPPSTLISPTRMVLNLVKKHLIKDQTNLLLLQILSIFLISTTSRCVVQPWGHQKLLYANLFMSNLGLCSVPTTLLETFY